MLSTVELELISLCTRRCLSTCSENFEEINIPKFVNDGNFILICSDRIHRHVHWGGTTSNETEHFSIIDPLIERRNCQQIKMIEAKMKKLSRDRNFV